MKKFALPTILTAMFLMICCSYAVIYSVVDSLNQRAVYLETKISKLENDLRNRGIIDKELLGANEYKPYSLEQMSEFKAWAEAQKSQAE
ncbi:MAG: hypothetical protein Q4A27_00615 [bacterium]|nr:hypothetical protein [bacterium]